MFTLLGGLLRYLFEPREFFILILGLDNAGKTVRTHARTGDTHPSQVALAGLCFGCGHSAPCWLGVAFVDDGGKLVFVRSPGASSLMNHPPCLFGPAVPAGAVQIPNKVVVQRHPVREGDANHWAERYGATHPLWAWVRRVAAARTVRALRCS